MKFSLNLKIFGKKVTNSEFKSEDYRKSPLLFSGTEPAQKKMVRMRWFRTRRW